MATKTPTKTTQSKTKAAQSKSQDSSKLPPTAEGTPLPTDESAAQHQAELEDLSKPGRASKADAEQIDNDPGYSKDQLAHMREYWGLTGDVEEAG